MKNALSAPADSPRSKPFMDQDGADPNATMKGDIPMHVDRSTAPGTKVKKPQPVASGNFHLRREHRSPRK